MLKECSSEISPMLALIYNESLAQDTVTDDSRWVGRQDSVGPAPPFFDSGGPQTGVWSTKTTKDGKCLSVIFIFW